MYKKLILPVAAAIVLATAGCSMLKPRPSVNIDKKTGTVATNTAINTVGAIDKILYGEWSVSNVAGAQVTGDTRPYVVFDTTMVNPFLLKVYANNGCNTLNGEIAVTPGGEMHKANNFLSTLEYCPDAPYAIGISMAFESVAKYKIDKVGRDYLLYMNNSAGKSLMVLRKCDISFINGAWAVTRIGEEAIPANKGIQFVIDVPELKIHGNTGCNILNGNIFIDPDKQNSIQFRDLATTRMACPDMTTEQALLVALEQVETAAPGLTATQALLKDAQGKTLLTLSRLDLKQQRELMESLNE